MKLDVPKHLHRNAPGTAEIGYEHTGQALINLAIDRMGLKDLRDKDILDVGCGVRFAMAIVNREIPIKSYAGLEVSLPIVDYLNENLAARDPRFQFAHWNVHNAMFNPNGIAFSEFDLPPFENDFDVIWLFSVFTHLAPTDALAMLGVLRKRIRRDGKLFFSAFIDANIDGFEDRVEGKPLLHAYYGKAYMDSLIEKAGWRIEAFHDREPDNYIMDYYVCSPA